MSELLIIIIIIIISFRLFIDRSSLLFRLLSLFLTQFFRIKISIYLIKIKFK